MAEFLAVLEHERWKQSPEGEVSIGEDAIAIQLPLRAVPETEITSRDPHDLWKISGLDLQRAQLQVELHTEWCVGRADAVVDGASGTD